MYQHDAYTAAASFCRVLLMERKDTSVCYWIYTKIKIWSLITKYLPLWSKHLTGRINEVQAVLLEIEFYIIIP